MGKILVEICLLSARGLRVGIGSSLLKHQWYAVGWLDPEDKYCTTIDASRSDNPVWRTKFATLLEDSLIQDSKSALHVEVYCREPIFLRKRLYGSATVSLKEFLTKYKQQQSASKSAIEESGSYQLRKPNSSKSQGFVDVSIRISAEREDLGGFTGDIGGVMLSNNSNYNTSGQDYMAGSSQQYPPQNPLNNLNPFSIPPYNINQPIPNPPLNNTSPPMRQPYYHPPPMQPPPPPSTAGYLPTYIPKSENVTNIASSSSGGAGRGYVRPGPGYAGYAAAMGAGAAVGAGAGLYGGDYMAGSNILSSLPHPNVSISIDPPF